MKGILNIALSFWMVAASVVYEGCSFIIDPESKSEYSLDSGRSDALDTGDYDLIPDYDRRPRNPSDSENPEIGHDKDCEAEDSGKDAETLDAAVDSALADAGIKDECLPQPELCDSIDNDCDGETDEDFPGIGKPCNGSECKREDKYACSPDQTKTFCFTGSKELSNPGFEMGYVNNKIPCWETVEGRPELAEKTVQTEGEGPVCEGHYALKPGEGNGERYSIQQVINVSDYALQIARGNLAVSARESATFNNDKGELELTFYDSNGSRINSSKTQNEITGNLCTQIESFGVAVPARTRYIELKLSGENMDGNTNNASHDAVSLELTVLNN